MVICREGNVSECFCRISPWKTTEWRQSRDDICAGARGGDPVKAKALLDTLVTMSKQRFVSPHNLAIAYAGIGDKEQFYQWLEQAIDEHSFIVNVSVLRVDPVFDFARKEPRFVALFKKTGLPPL
jgi:hypothetical protein